MSSIPDHSVQPDAACLARPGIPVKACVFDAYGTLLDFASATKQCYPELGDKTDTLTAMWRDKQLQYTWLRTLQGTHADFWEVTSDALDYCLACLDIKDAQLRERLLNLYLRLDCFAEVTTSLRRLKIAGFPLAILSNGTPTMLETATKHAAIFEYFDHIISAEETKKFKTHPSVYQLALDLLNLDAESIIFVSSNAWDAHAASAFGMQVAWCNRYNQHPENLPGSPDFEITSLAQLPDLIVTA